MGPYYEICPVGQDDVWFIWREDNQEMKHRATTSQRELLAELVERQDRELQKMLRQFTFEGGV